MEIIGLLEESNAFRYAILSTKVSQILKKIQHNKELKDHDYATLERGALLLKQIIEGSILISQKRAMNGFSASQEGLSAYGHALSAAEKLGLLKEHLKDHKDFTDLFMFLYNELVSLSKKNRSNKDVIETLLNFFNMLSKLFTADLHKDSFYKSKEPLATMHSRRSVYYAYI